MKKILILAVTFGLFFSCSSDDGGGTTTENNTDYFPAGSGSTWTYNYNQSVQGVNNSGNTTTSIGANRTIDGESYQMLSNTQFLIGSMDEVPFKKSGTNLIIRPIVDFMGNVWDFENIDFIQSGMNAGELLGESTREFVGEAMDIPDENITGTVVPHTFITIKSNHVAKSNSLAVNGQNYSNIAHNRLSFEIRVVIDIDATATLGGQPINIVRSHELVSQQPYGALNIFMVKDVGIIQTNYDYSFENVNMNTQINLGGLTLDLLDLAPELSNFNSSLDVSGNANLTSHN